MSRIDRVIAALSASRAGVISTKLAEAEGINDSAILRRARGGTLFRMFDGVYLVGHPALTPERVWSACVLYAGERCALSRRAGLEARTLLREARPWDVAVAVDTRGREIVAEQTYERKSIVLTLHESSALPRRTRATKIAAGLPVLSVPDLLVDISWHAPNDFPEALRNAEYRGLVKDRDLRRLLRRGRGGSAAVRAELVRRDVGSRRTQNELEDAGYDLAVALGLPIPETNVVIMTPDGPIRVDLYWRALGLVIELDGGPAHGTVGGMNRDRDNVASLRGVGLDVMRFSWRQITRDRRKVKAALVGAGYLCAAT